MKRKTLQILDEQYQQIDEGLWDRTKAKAAGIGSFLTAGKNRSEAYQNTAQSKLIDGKIAKISKIISSLEDDIMKSTGLSMSEIQTRYPAIFSEIQKIKNSVSTTAPSPSPPPLPSKPTFDQVFNAHLSSIGRPGGTITEGEIPAFLNYLLVPPSEQTTIINKVNSVGRPRNSGTVVSNPKKNALRNELKRLGITV